MRFKFMKKIVTFLFLILAISVVAQDKKVIKYAKTIKSKDLMETLTILASDEYEGRETGQKGQKMAADYIAGKFSDFGLAPVNGSFFQKFAFKASDFDKTEGKMKEMVVDTENVIGYLQGREWPNELVIVTAHYDHIGIRNGEINNGADDDGSGTSTVLELAEAFATAASKGQGPKRSILFMTVSGEEMGLVGSKYYTDNPLFPLESTVTNLNIDMVGRVDDAHLKNPDYIYLIGSDRLSQDLHDLSEEANKTYTKMNLDYKYNDVNDPERFYYRSDHYNFAKNNIPVIFYFNGTHADYHRPTDTIEKINFELMEKRARLIFHTAWEVANRSERITADKLDGVSEESK